MANILIVHGVGGSPEENWFPWLKKELEKLGHNVIVPQFPTPEGQYLDRWLQVLEPYDEFLNKDTIVVGHSLGVPFLLNVIENKSVYSAFLVAGFTGKIGHQFDESMKTFAQRDFNWEKIRKNCKNFYIFHSDNDPYVRLDKAEELEKNLDSKIILMKKAGHINEGSGYFEFHELLEEIRNL